MLKKLSRAATAHAGATLVLLSGLVLGGCQLDDAVTEDYFVPARHYERYPIKVVKSPVSVGVSARAGALSPGQINAVANFARQARSNSASRIKVSYPSAGGQSRKVAGDIADLMSNQGISHSMIAVTSYRGGRGDPVHISYVSRVAVTLECGDWSENLASTRNNEVYSNFGCATQNNIAAMVSNPEDFETPRAMTPIDGPAAANRTVALAIYMTGKAGADTESNATASSGTVTGGE